VRLRLFALLQVAQHSTAINSLVRALLHAKNMFACAQFLNDPFVFRNRSTSLSLHTDPAADVEGGMGLGVDLSASGGGATNLNTPFAFGCAAGKVSSPPFWSKLFVKILPAFASSVEEPSSSAFVSGASLAFWNEFALLPAACQADHESYSLRS